MLLSVLTSLSYSFCCVSHVPTRKRSSGRTGTDASLLTLTLCFLLFCLLFIRGKSIQGPDLTGLPRTDSERVLPREPVSGGVLEYQIQSSTIWNRCSWAGEPVTGRAVVGKVDALAGVIVSRPTCVPLIRILILGCLLLLCLLLLLFLWLASICNSNSSL